MRNKRKVQIHKPALFTEYLSEIEELTTDSLTIDGWRFSFTTGSYMATIIAEAEEFDTEAQMLRAKKRFLKKYKEVYKKEGS